MIYNLSDYNQHWDTRKLDELGTFSRGKSKHRPRNDPKLFQNGKYPLIQTGDVKASEIFVTSHYQEYSEFGLKQSKLWNKGTLCITIAANIAETAIIAYPMCFPDSIVGFNAFENESSEVFMHYIFSYIRNSIQNSVSGSIQDNINIDYLMSLDFKIPKKEYQDNIVDVLFALDQKIAFNNRIISELESMAKTIYDYWFVQFDFPNAKGKPYRQSGGEMVYNEPLKREIPKGWEVVTLSTFIGEERGGDWGKESCESAYTEKVICVRGADFPGLLGKQTLNAPTRFIFAKNMGKQLSAGDIIVEVSGGSPSQSTGRISYINEQVLSRFDIPIITSNFCKAFSLKDERWQYWFYILWSKLYDAGVFFKYEGKTTGIKNLLFDILCNDYKVVMPKQEMVYSFDEMVTPFFKKIQKANIENLELTRLRDWLLPMLMSGQATVADEDKPVLHVYQTSTKNEQDRRFELWLQNQGLAARGDIDRQTLREIFDAMDDDDK